MNRLEVVSVHYNFSGYKAPVQNYHKWREQFPFDVRVLELVIGDAEPEIPDSIVVRGTEKNIAWQKEAMLNILFKTSKKDFIVWSDHDVLIDNPHTLAIAERMLDYKHEVIQCFSNLVYLDAHGRKYDSREGAVFNYQMYRNTRGNSGMLWAARTEFLQRVKLPDFMVLGSGDRVFSDAVLRNKSNTLRENEQNFTPELRLRVSHYMSHVRSRMKGQVGFITNEIQHLYHGNSTNRRYSFRYKNFPYVPIRDIFINKDGLVEWVHDTPQHVIDYFNSRKEDE